MDSDQRQHLEKVRKIHSERLRLLEVQEATTGSDTRPHIQIEITDLKGKIEDINAQLAGKAITQILNSKSSTRSSIGVLPLILSFFLVSGVIGWFAYRRGEDKAKVLGQTTVASLPTSTLQEVSITKPTDVAYKPSTTSATSEVFPTTTITPSSALQITPTNIAEHNVPNVKISPLSDNPCTSYRVIPESIDIDNNPIESWKKMGEYMRDGSWKSWKVGPKIIPINDGTRSIDGFEINLTVSNDKLNGSWIRISNQFEVIIQPKDTILKQEKVLNACEGGFYTKEADKIVSLKNDSKEYKVDVTFPEFDGYKLASGEFDEFLILMRCDMPGEYVVKISIPYVVDTISTSVDYSEQRYLCPNSFVMYSGTPMGDVNKPSVNVEWTDEGYRYELLP